VPPLQTQAGAPPVVGQLDSLTSASVQVAAELFTQTGVPQPQLTPVNCVLPVALGTAVQFPEDCSAVEVMHPFCWAHPLPALVPASKTQFAARHPADPPVDALSNAAAHAAASEAGSQPFGFAAPASQAQPEPRQVDSDQLDEQVVTVGVQVACHVQLGPPLVLPAAGAGALAPVQTDASACAAAAPHAPVVLHPFPGTAPASK
jgi:hypothetical protein